MRDHFPHISQILEGIHFGANTCRACIRTRVNTGKYSWRIIYVLVSCQGVQLQLQLQKSARITSIFFSERMVSECLSAMVCGWSVQFVLAVKVYAAISVWKSVAIIFGNGTLAVAMPF